MLAAEDVASVKQAAALGKQAVIVVLGAPGASEYEGEFRAWADQWKQAADKGDAYFTLIGAEAAGDEPDRTMLEQAIAELAAASGQITDAELAWIVLIGHGSFDGETAKFNLRGPDASAKDLAQWLAPVTTPLAVINCASASAPFLAEASAQGRIVIVATKSGHEQNYARFGKYLAEAIDDPAADLDKDEQVSLLEAYLTACRGVAEYYQGEERLATEHALLDDNGDGLGTPADWFRGLRATQRAKEGAALDGARAHQLHLVPSRREARLPREVRERRDGIELELAKLREERASLGDQSYYERLEPLMVELARLYADAEEPDGAR
jgi:hypothetical protein